MLHDDEEDGYIKSYTLKQDQRFVIAESISAPFDSRVINFLLFEMNVWSRFFFSSCYKFSHLQDVKFVFSVSFLADVTNIKNTKQQLLVIPKEKYSTTNATQKKKKKSFTME